ncbi:MAG: PEP-CTERM sorting domain-containing protein [Candidatus Korobacteraceae bacterium]
MNRKILALSALSMLVLFSIAARAQNLFTNGDFEQGNTGFTTDYTYVPGNGTVHTVPPDYSIINNPATAFTNGYLSYGDHTSGSGLMFFADGGAPSLNVWAENLNLAAGMYTFTAWVADPDLNLANPETLDLFLNGTETNNSFTSTQVGQWQEWTFSLNVVNSGNTLVSIRDLNQNYNAGNNDFTMDDLSLTSATPEPGSFLLLGSGILGCIGAVRKRMG